MKIRICFEIEGLAVDENGNPAPAGLCMTLDMSDDTKLPSYQELVKSIKKEGLLQMTCLDGLAQPDDVVFITSEEYDRKYGEAADA